MRFFRRIEFKPGWMSGWKHFAFEVAIIVIGVSVTLIAQEIITDASQAREARQALDAVEVDLAGLLVYSSERLAVETCRRESVTDLAARLSRFNESWTAKVPESINRDAGPFVLSRILRMPSRPWEAVSMRALLASDVALHIDRKLFAALSITFKNSERISVLQADAQKLYGRLSYLAVSGPLDNAQRRQAYADLGELAVIDGLISLISGQMRDAILKYDFQNEHVLEDQRFTAFAGFLHSVRSIYGGCVALSEFQPTMDKFSKMTGRRFLVEKVPAP